MRHFDLTMNDTDETLAFETVCKHISDFWGRVSETRELTDESYDFTMTAEDFKGCPVDLRLEPNEQLLFTAEFCITPNPERRFHPSYYAVLTAHDFTEEEDEQLNEIICNF